MVDIFDSACTYRHSALDKVTRRKNSPKKKEPITELQNLDLNPMSKSQFRSTNTKLQMALEKSLKDSRDFVIAEVRSNQA